MIQTRNRITAVFESINRRQNHLTQHETEMLLLNLYSRLTVQFLVETLPASAGFFTINRSSPQYGKI